MRRTAAGLLAVGALIAAAGCSSSSSSPSVTIPKARVFQITDFRPSGRIEPGRPVELSFIIQQPSGAPLTRYKRGAGPHTGVHIIVVRDDLSVIIHRHPPIAADGRISERITFPKPGPYRILLDVYPRLAGPLRNFQLNREVTVAGRYDRQPLPRYRPVDTEDGYRVAMHGSPRIRALKPTIMRATVTTPAGARAPFTPYFGALAHAIFFKAGSLDYFHTHVCGPNTPGCTSFVSPTRVTTRSRAPGQLNIVAFVPLPGTWRLFLQTKVGDRVITAPFTLRVRP